MSWDSRNSMTLLITSQGHAHSKFVTQSGLPQLCHVHTQNPFSLLLANTAALKKQHYPFIQPSLCWTHEWLTAQVNISSQFLAHSLEPAQQICRRTWRTWTCSLDRRQGFIIARNAEFIMRRRIMQTHQKHTKTHLWQRYPYIASQCHALPRPL